MCCAGQVDAGQAQRSILFAWLLGAVLAFGALTIVAQGRLDRTTASVEDGAKDLADLFENIDGLSDDLLVYANGASDAAARLLQSHGPTRANPPIGATIANSEFNELRRYPGAKPPVYHGDAPMF